MDWIILLAIILLFLALVFSRMEIAFSFGVIAFLWLYISGEPVVTVIRRTFNGLDSFVLLAIPFFLLAGELMNRSGIIDSLFNAANLTFGRIKGGLAQANIFSSMLFAGISGGAVVDVMTIGSIFVPAMAKEGYDRAYTAAVTAASSVVGPIIPPSIIIVIYGGVTGTSVGALFAAAIVPGIILGVFMLGVSVFIAYRDNMPRYQSELSMSDYPDVLGEALIASTIPAIILIGILGGYVTVTEASVLACFWAFIIGFFVYGGLRFEELYSSVEVTVERSTQILIIIGLASPLSWLLAREGIPQAFNDAVLSVASGDATYLLLIVVFLIFVGMWLEVSAAVILLAPIFVESGAVVGIHSYQLGMVIILALNFGTITPPLGICLFGASSVAEVRVWEIAKRIIPYYISYLLAILLVIYIPEITLFLPEYFGFA